MLLELLSSSCGCVKLNMPRQALSAPGLTIIMKRQLWRMQIRIICIPKESWALYWKTLKG